MWILRGLSVQVAPKDLTEQRPFPPPPRPLCLWDEQCISRKPVMKGEGRAFVLGCEGLYSPSARREPD